VSQENLEVLRSWVEHWNERDMDAHSDLYAVDAEVITDPSWMEAGPFKGRAEIRKWFEGLAEPWDGRDEVVQRELFEAGDKVVLRFDWEVRGGKSGLEMTLDATSVNVLDNGRIARQQYFFDYTAALKAVGLEE
jgi:ketosteroid isomerase-like protein